MKIRKLERKWNLINCELTSTLVTGVNVQSITSRYMHNKIGKSSQLLYFLITKRQTKFLDVIKEHEKILGADFFLIAIEARSIFQ